MLTEKTIEAFMELAPELAAAIPGGAIICYIRDGRFVWVENTIPFELPYFTVGNAVSTQGGAAQAMREKVTIRTVVPRSVYGVSLKITSLPVWDNDRVIGAVSICTINSFLQTRPRKSKAL